jgi:type IV secretion system protein VirB10
MAASVRQIEDEADDLLPIVRRSTSALPGWMVAGFALVAAVLLFTILESRRQAASVPAVRPRHSDLTTLPQAIPPLYVPPALPTQPERVAIAPLLQPSPVVPKRDVPPPEPRIIYYPTPPQPQPQQIAPQPPPRAANDAVLVFDGTAAESAPPAGPDSSTTDGGASNLGGASRASAFVLRHRPTMVPQGTLIAAVLETALDSTRPGLARALVSRDVYGFDGSRLLIPRGSRLIGEYKGDLSSGQNRALIIWTRLVRPDGAAIALASPSADPLGRIGIKGRVNSHFFARFGEAILQSSLDVGVALASRNANSPVIVALPNAVRTAAGPISGGNEVRPTLKVRQGTAVSVFVARDLDFTKVEK